MAKKKKLETSVNETTNSTNVGVSGNVGFDSGIEELKIDGGLTVTREELNQVVAKINELVRKVN